MFSQTYRLFDPDIEFILESLPIRIFSVELSIITLINISIFCFNIQTLLNLQTS